MFGLRAGTSLFIAARYAAGRRGVCYLSQIVEFLRLVDASQRQRSLATAKGPGDGRLAAWSAALAARKSFLLAARDNFAEKSAPADEAVPLA